MINFLKRVISNLYIYKLSHDVMVTCDDILKETMKNKGKVDYVFGKVR